MASESKHISVHIERPPADVYEYAADPARLPEWAPGLCSAVERDGDRWYAISGADRIELTFAPDNPLGVLDHTVHLPTGEVFRNPIRVIPHDDGSELVFTLRRRAGMSDADFAHDGGLVLADLEALKRIVEAR